jgi:hypothetical protein
MRILTDINLLKGRGKYQFGAFLQALILEIVRRFVMGHGIYLKGVRKAILNHGWTRINTDGTVAGQVEA